MECTEILDGSPEERGDFSAMYAANELHSGRLEWLAEHIRRSNFQISPMVARKLLALIERTQENLYCSSSAPMAQI